MENELPITTSAPTPLPARRSGLRRLMTWAIMFLVLGGGVWILSAGLCAAYRGSQAVHCENNLRNIAAACAAYATSHNGHYPNSFADLAANEQIEPYMLVCEASGDLRAEGTRQQQVAAYARGEHLSYVYVADGLTSDADANTVLIYERKHNHTCGIGMLVLFGDYHSRVGGFVSNEANRRPGRRGRASDQIERSRSSLMRACPILRERVVCRSCRVRTADHCFWAAIGGPRCGPYKTHP